MEAVERDFFIHKSPESSGREGGENPDSTVVAGKATLYFETSGKFHIPQPMLSQLTHKLPRHHFQYLTYYSSN